MSTMASQITNLMIVYSIVYSGADQVNMKAPRHWPLCGEFTGDRWIPRTNGQQRGKCFHLMTSSWSVGITWSYSKSALCILWYVVTSVQHPFCKVFVGNPCWAKPSFGDIDFRVVYIITCRCLLIAPLRLEIRSINNSLGIARVSDIGATYSIIFAQ